MRAFTFVLLAVVLALGGVIWLSCREPQPRETNDSLTQVPANSSASRPVSNPLERNNKGTPVAPHAESPGNRGLARAQKPEEQLDKDIAGKSRHLVETEAQLREVGELEKRSNRRWDLTVAQTQEKSSKDLLKYLFDTPLCCAFLMYSDPNDGIERLRRGCEVFAQFLLRPNALDAILEYLSELDDVQQAVANPKEGARAGLRGMLGCQLLLFPAVKEKTKGSEWRVIKVLSEREAKIRRVSDIMGKRSPYGMIPRQWDADVALAMWGQVDPRAAEEWKGQNLPRGLPEGDDLFEGCEEPVIVRLFEAIEKSPLRAK